MRFAFQHCCLTDQTELKVQLQLAVRFLEACQLLLHALQLLNLRLAGCDMALYLWGGRELFWSCFAEENEQTTIKAVRSDPPHHTRNRSHLRTVKLLYHLTEGISHWGSGELHIESQLPRVGSAFVASLAAVPCLLAGLLQRMSVLGLGY